MRKPQEYDVSGTLFSRHGKYDRMKKWKFMKNRPESSPTGCGGGNSTMCRKAPVPDAAGMKYDTTRKPRREIGTGGSPARNRHRQLAGAK